MRLLAVVLAAGVLIAVLRARQRRDASIPDLPDEMASVQADRYWLSIPGPVTGRAWRN